MVEGTGVRRGACSGAVGIGLALRLQRPVSAALAPFPVLLINVSLLASIVLILLLPLEHAAATLRAPLVGGLATAPYLLAWALACFGARG